MKKITILHLIYSWKTGIYGAERIVLKLVSNLSKSKFNCVVVTIKHSKKDKIPLLKELNKNGIVTDSLILKGRFDITSVVRCKNLLKKYKAEILHCHGYKADIIGLFTGILLPKIKLVATLHGWWARESFKLKFYEFLDLFAVKRFDRIIVVSKAIQATLLSKRFFKGKLELIHNGVEISRFIDEKNSESLKARLKINKEDKVIGLVGRLGKEKGHIYLLEAMPDIIEQFPKVKVIILGEGILENELKTYAKKLKISDKLMFLGFKKDMVRFYALMDVFVLPSLSEGLPVALLEAMVARKAIVATNVGGIPSVIKNMETGILIEPKNSNLLVKAISKVLNNKNLAFQLAVNARRIAECTFSIDAMIKKYEKVYCDMLSANKKQKNKQRI